MDSKGGRKQAREGSRIKGGSGSVCVWGGGEGESEPSRGNRLYKGGARGGGQACQGGVSWKGKGQIARNEARFRCTD